MNNMNIEKVSAEIGLARMFGARFPLSDDRIDQFRRNSFERFSETGLPAKKAEAWKYTDVRKAMNKPLPIAFLPGTDEVTIADELATLGKTVRATRLTFVNGYFEPGLSDVAKLPLGLEVLQLANAERDGTSLVAELLARTPQSDDVIDVLNGAFFVDGALVRIAEGVKLEEPMHLRHLYIGGDPFASVSRVLVMVGDGASATILETHEAPAAFAYQRNTVLQISVGDGAAVSHVRVSDDTSSLMSLSKVTAKIGTGSDLKTFNIAGNGPFWRHQADVIFAGEGSTATVSGSALLTNREHGDTTIFVDHASPRCESRELFKTVVDREATGVFQGKIIVRPDSQKTDGRMMSAALLLSRDATMNNKPELEIFADDVVCAHGATCGQLNDDLLFYLMSRGLSRLEAELVMLQAFLGEATETIADENIREAVSAFVHSWLTRR
jgi:Fe-S cluster assembly protein SufD